MKNIGNLYNRSNKDPKYELKKIFEQSEVC